jgi:carbohydrate esterase-like sialic acid-specific acetylesterase
MTYGIAALQQAGFEPTYVLWHQGEADALYGTSTDHYAVAFRALAKSIRDLDIRAPIYVATASYFAVPEGYDASQSVIRRAQQSLISSEDVILPGPDTDLIRDRFDGCHMGSTGLREHAQMWQTSLHRTRHRCDATVPVPRSGAEKAEARDRSSTLQD